MGRILISSNSNIYRLLTFRLSHSDGSFYIAFVRQGKTSPRWRGEMDMKNKALVIESQSMEEKSTGARISYHASGLIRFHNLSNSGIYAEPIFQITKPFGFIRYSVPSIEKLDLFSKSPSVEDVVLDIPNNHGNRINFDCAVAPWNFVGANSIGIRYRDLFSFNVSLNTEEYSMPSELNEAFHYLTPNNGLYSQTLFDRDTALLHFHQRVNKTKELIIYSPNVEGVYTLIFSVPMRITPKVKIEFQQSEYQLEILIATYTHLKFRVKDSSGNIIKTEVQIASIELDAEL